MSVEFVDTNILVYTQDLDMGFKRQQSVDLIARLGRTAGVAISTQVLIEFYSTATRKLLMSSLEAEAVIREWTGWMTIHRTDPTDILRGAGLQRQFQISWFDALILNSALELGCSTLWTEDFNHGQQYSTLTVRNPFA